MKNYGKETILMLIVGCLMAYFLPWWTLAIAGAIVAAFLSKKNVISYAAGFTAGGLIWGVWAFLIDTQNTGILSARMGDLFGGISGMQLIAATSFIGAVICAMGALTGASFRKLLVGGENNYKKSI